MGFVRFGTGRDAADVAFATIFGSVKSYRPTVRALAIEDATQGLVRPRPTAPSAGTATRPTPNCMRTCSR